MENTKPVLTENITKFYIRHSLKEVRIFKNKYINIIVNLLLFIGFLGMIGLLLYFRYKGKLTPEEIKAQQTLKKNYLFEKLHKISYEKQKENQNLITDLPII